MAERPGWPQASGWLHSRETFELEWVPNIHSSLCAVSEYVPWRAIMSDHLWRKAALPEAAGRLRYPHPIEPRDQGSWSYPAEDRHQPPPPSHPVVLRYRRVLADECGPDSDSSEYLPDA